MAHQAIRKVAIAAIEVAEGCRLHYHQLHSRTLPCFNVRHLAFTCVHQSGRPEEKVTHVFSSLRSHNRICRLLPGIQLCLKPQVVGNHQRAPRARRRTLLAEPPAVHA